MSGKNSIDIKATADLVENESTAKRKKEAESIETQQKEAAKKAEEAREEAKRKEQERLEKELAEKKAREEQRAKEAAAAKEAEEARLAAARQKEELIGAGLALAGTAIAGTAGKKNSGGFWKAFLLGLIVGALGLWFLMPKQTAPAAPDPTPVPIEDAEVTVENNGFLGYTAADFQNAVLGAASEHQELIVMEQPLSIATTITKAGLGNLPIFAKMKDVTYYGTGVYTVDLSGMDASRILVDEETCTVTVKIPHTVLQYVNPELSRTEFEDTEKGLLAFGDIKLTAEETNQLEQSVYDAMRERLDSDDLYEEADRFAKLKTWEIFQPLVTAVSPMYKVEMEFID